MPTKKKRSTRARKRVAPWQGSLRIALVFAALIAVNLYIFVIKPKTSLRALLARSELAKQGSQVAIVPDDPVTPSAPLRPRAIVEEDDGRVVDGTVAELAALSGAMKGEGVSSREANEVMAALAGVVDGNAPGGDVGYALRFDPEERLRAVELRVAPSLAYHIERANDGWKASRDERSHQLKVVELGGMWGSSLPDSLRRSGELPSLATMFTDLFAADVDFYTDAQPGDRYKIIVEKHLAGGKLLRYGRIVAAEWQSRGTTLRAFWFQPQDGTPGGYYTEHGERVDKALVRAPLRWQKLPATFDRHRLHPVPHVDHGSSGVDYGAPTGTPVWASGAGRITFAGPRPGLGNVVVVAHPGGLESTYAHLGRFARGLRPGVEVRQRQVIGYAGPAPLHYALKQSGVAVDPLRFKPSRGEPLTGRYRVELADSVTARLTALAAIDPRGDRAAALP